MDMSSCSSTVNVRGTQSSRHRLTKPNTNTCVWYPEGIWGDGEPRNERRHLARSERGSRRRWRRKTKVEAVAAATWSRTCVNKYMYTYTKAGTVVEEKRR